MRIRSGRAASATTALMGVGLLVVLPGQPARAATTYVVDGASPACTDAGTGSADAPFCTITAAARKAIAAGDTVQVAAGVYREQVNVAGSGTADAPIRFQASGPGVVVLGTTDLSGAAGWTATGTNAWSRPYAPPTAPRQVFLDDRRLATASGPSATTTNSFFYDAVAKVLYVDIGGANPGDGHTVEAGAQSFGFNVASRSNVIVAGFATRRQNNAGVRVLSSTDVTVSGISADEQGVNGLLVDGSTGGAVLTDSSVRRALSVGIRVSNSAGTVVRRNTSSSNGFHGIGLNASTGVLVDGNTVSANAAPGGGTTTASGIDVNNNSTAAVVVANTAFDNQDSGVQFYNGSNNAVVARNVSYSNGDHGFDTNKSTGVRYVSNTSYGNRRDGFSVEGTSTGTRLTNNIAMDNGISTAHHDISVDGLSTAGFTADRDIVWNSVARPSVQFGATVYPSLTAFATATGHEGKGQAHDPRFASPASGDFRLRPNSPAIDAADAAVDGFRAGDRSGQAPVDDPSVPDTGGGAPTYADIGALELAPPSGGPFSYPPNAALVLDPTSGEVPHDLVVTADASGSSDPDGSPIASYRFDFGDGTVVGPQASPVATHGYSAAGNRTVTVTVTDTGGRSSTASRAVTVTVRTPVTYTVDGASTSCSDIGPGDSGTPFCRISTAASRLGPGDTVRVRPATYREEVNVVTGGAPGFVTTFLATGPGVSVMGTDDVSNSSAWVATSATTWRRAFAPASPPTQVFLDGTRLAAATSATGMPPNSWFHDALAGQLYVDLGGPNPGEGHTVEAGARTYGFKVWDVSHVTLRGFAMRGQNSNAVTVARAASVTVDQLTVSDTGSHGIQVDSTSGSSVTSTEVSRAGSIGIRLANSAGMLVQGNSTHDNGFHGISLNATRNSQVAGNTAFRNARPAGGTANGIELNVGSTDNAVTANTTYGNQDSGIQVYNGSNRTVVNRNVTYDNGDHGIDVLNTTSVAITGNTVYRNTMDGLSVEGTSTGASVRNNILVDNGLSTAEYDLYVDDAAVSGFSADRDLVRSQTGAAVKYNLVVYDTLASFATATGHEAQGTGADALFLNAGARDLRPSGDSPAVDRADAGAPGFRAADHAGRTPVDNPAVPNTGAGSPAYADLGAYEFAGPAAALTATPASGSAPVTVTASAAGTTALGAPLATYQFSFGDGAMVGPQPGATASHVYATAGTFTMTVTVTDAAGFTDTATASVVVSGDQPPVAKLTLTPANVAVPGDLVADASGSTDADSTPIASYTFNCGNGTVVGPQATAKATCSYSAAGTFTVTVTVRDTAGLQGTASKSLTAFVEKPPVASLTIKPLSPVVGFPVTLNASASTDTDPTPIASYTFACGNGVVIGPQSSARATCKYTTAGTYTARVTVKDTAGLTGTASKTVLVR